MTASRRTGPRPLGLHLAAASAISTSSLLAWPLLRSGWTPWNESPPPGGKELLAELESVSPEAFAKAVTAEIARRNDAFLTGIETYRSHPFSRQVEPPPPLWQSGAAQLLDYGVTAPEGVNGRPVLFVPSLVNRSHILDLTPDRSLMRYLAARGFRPLLLDWGTPGEDELRMTFDDAIGGTMREALSAATECADGPVPVVGYCMGGTMAVALAGLAAENISGLAVLAAPWDFHAGFGGPPPAISAGRATLEGMIATLGYLPVDAIQTLFFCLDPVQGWVKFRDFAQLDADGLQAIAFVALEDWLNDGVALAGPIARDCLFGWYGDNLPGSGRWSVCGTRIDPATIDVPALAVLPSGDRIVPPESAAALARILPHCLEMRPAGGHIGMVVGRKARTMLWSPLADWLGELG